MGEKYTIECFITNEAAHYTIDDEMIAECTYEDGTIPAKGYFGFANYNPDEWKNILYVEIEKLNDREQRKFDKAHRKANMVNAFKAQLESENGVKPVGAGAIVSKGISSHLMNPGA